MSKPSTTSSGKAIGLVTENPWQALKQFTSARIALGRAGTSIPTQQLLPFQLDHARAIDAVHKALAVESLIEQLQASSAVQTHTKHAPMVVSSKANDRMTYLQRPDLGRQLCEASWQSLLEHREKSSQEYDLAIVVADGLSSTAIQHHAAPVIESLVTKLTKDDKYPWSLAPLIIVKQGRVAVGDDVGECLKAKITLILIGERPGLTSPDSMGIYITWNPKRGAKDSSRNCISNIRPEGLCYEEASHKAFYLLTESMKTKCTGIGLKDRSLVVEDSTNLESNPKSQFLVSAAKDK
ncbi:ethanolamine ammonia-lyase subunit EutC [Agarivorans sp. B2Z047]|uniref:ethanolamine ammonia-lyase subunit EutC n=1 Tax=Agarivorans sp. B2Z047 TaxID=2652721 RepID=UPI00128DD868|nr:ethanolamine ammonia-lyase subunit EutC [Agarivorans sp. B2Z047]MPW30967.1 ethanolamine ammonia-lyase subunit EutC [Agarivorans sp. B2Z047]UQN40806.1 ethanolamine ammonia-lyase subunit EutC [Agarivorans sp. B2Z047]